MKSEKIKCHKKDAVNMKLFLEEFSIKSFWNGEDNEYIYLTANVESTTDHSLLKKIIKEYTYAGFIPYHFFYDYEKKGMYVTDERVGVLVYEIVQKKFNSLSGGFNLIYFVGADGNNYLWKCYNKDKEFPSPIFSITGRKKVNLTGKNKEKINLINWVRIKDDNKDSKE